MVMVSGLSLKLSLNLCLKAGFASSRDLCNSISVMRWASSYQLSFCFVVVEETAWAMLMAAEGPDPSCTGAGVGVGAGLMGSADLIAAMAFLRISVMASCSARAVDDEKEKT